MQKKPDLSANPCYLTATEQVAALARKEISAVELLEKTITRIELLDAKINAVVVRDFENARLAAKNADDAIARNESLPLLGLPITIKESFNVAGLPTSWGNPIHKNYIPSEDALAVTRLKKAGAIIIGKTNVPVMLQDWQTYNPLYGTSNNPYDLSLTPGGSSGGSAAALAAGFVSLELGSDFAGSIRIPAHFCGVFGHKPSIHLIPLRGASPPPSPPSPHARNDLVVAGPLARSASDLRLALNILAGPDELWDGKGYKLTLPPSRHKYLKNFKVLVINSHPVCPTNNVTRKSLAKLIDRFVQLNMTVADDIKLLPDLECTAQTYLTLFSAFMGAMMPLEDYQEIEQQIKNQNPKDHGFVANFFRGCAISHRTWEQTNHTRMQLRQKWCEIYNKFDVVICPIMPTPAFPHDHSLAKDRQIEIDGKLFPYSNQYFWPSIASLFGLPATVLPIDNNKGLPIGVQVIGNYLDDLTTLKFAELLEQEIGGFSAPNQD